MKKSTGIALIIAAVLVILGGAGILSALAITDCNMQMFSPEKYELKTEEITGDFQSIHINESEAEVRIVPTAGSTASVEYVYIQDRNYNITVENGILDIRVSDERSWFNNIGINFTSPMTLTVMLPEQEYAELYVNNGSGGVEVSDSFTFTAAEIDSGSGGVTFNAAVNGDMSIDSGSGGVHIGSDRVNNLICDVGSGGVDMSGITADSIKVDSGSGKVEAAECGAALLEIKSSSGGTQIVSCQADSLLITSGSGKINVYDSEFGDVDMRNSSGGLYLENTVASGRMTLESGSGGVKFDRIDAQELKIKSSSGGVKGTLLSGKMFSVSVGSGSMEIPKDDPNGGYCEINTGSGSINITIAEE